VKLAVASSSEVSLPVLNFLANNKYELELVITNPDKATGRGRVITPNAVSAWCAENKITVSKPSNEQELLAIFNQNNIDLLITVAYGHILKAELLSKPRFGAINLHYSLLPKYRGAAPVQHAILNGDKKTGVTVFKLDAGMDSGPIYVQQEIEINSSETTPQLIARLNIIGVDLIEKTLKMISEGVQPKAQPETNITFAPKFSKSDGEINWQSSSEEIFNQYRALESNPGVYTTHNDIKIKISTMKEDSTETLAPGVFSVVDESLLVGTKTNDLRIDYLIPEGRKVMSGKDFFNGLQEKAQRSFT